VADFSEGKQRVSEGDDHGLAAGRRLGRGDKASALPLVGWAGLMMFSLASLSSVVSGPRPVQAAWGGAQPTAAQPPGTQQPQALQPGDWVVVVAESPLKIRDDVVGTLYPGSIARVIQVSGKWLALEGQRGWIDQAFVKGVQAAKRHYIQQVAANRRDLAAWSILASLHHHLQEYSLAVEAYNHALELDPRLPQLFNNRGLTLLAQGLYESAEKDFQSALELAPKFGQAHANLGWLYFNQDRLEEALLQYDRAIELDKELERENAAHFVHRGGCLREMGRLDEALRDFSQAIQIAGNIPSAFVGQSTVYLDRMDLESALTAANRALELDPQNARAMTNRGWAKFLQGHVEESLSDLNQALTWEPDFLVALVNRSAIQVELGQWDQAELDLQKAMKVDDQHPAVWLNLGELRWRQRDFAGAKEAYETSLKLGPDLADSLNALAWFLATCPVETMRDPALALRHAQTACGLTENQDWSHLDTLAAAQAANGQFQQAAATAEAALKLAPEEKRSEVQERLNLYRQDQAFITT